MDERSEPATIDVKRDEAVTITFGDGAVARFDLDDLRKSCPCAECRGRRERGEVVWPRPGSPTPLRIDDAALHGAWGLSVTWNDGHATGIFPSTPCAAGTTAARRSAPTRASPDHCTDEFAHPERSYCWRRCAPWYLPLASRAGAVCGGDRMTEVVATDTEIPPELARESDQHRVALTGYCYRMLGSASRPRTPCRRPWCGRGRASTASKDARR